MAWGGGVDDPFWAVWDAKTRGFPQIGFTVQGWIGGTVLGVPVIES